MGNILRRSGFFDSHEGELQSSIFPKQDFLTGYSVRRATEKEVNRMFLRRRKRRAVRRPCIGVGLLVNVGSCLHHGFGAGGCGRSLAWDSDYETSGLI